MVGALTRAGLRRLAPEGAAFGAPSFTTMPANARPPADAPASGEAASVYVSAKAKDGRTLVWERATREGNGGKGKVTVRVEGHENRQVEVDEEHVTPASDMAEKGLPDMAQLDILHEAALLENIVSRYNREDIYTACGSLLVSMNPYKALPLYSDDVIDAYIQAGRADARAVARGTSNTASARHAGTDANLRPRRSPHNVEQSGISGNST